MSNFKKILLGILLLAIVGGIGYAIYFVFFKPATGPVTTIPATNTNTGTGGNLNPSGTGTNIPYVPPSNGTGTLPQASPIARGGATLSTILVGDPTLGQTLAADGKTIRYYNRATGKFMAVDANGNIVELSDQVFSNVQNVTWSGDGNKVVMEFPDGSKLTYDFLAKKQNTIPASWNDFSFSPGSDQLAALQISDSSTSRYLVTAGSDGTGVKAIEPLGDNADKVKVAWSPAGDILALSSTGDAGTNFGQKTVLFIGKNGENFPGTEITGLNFTPRWSPDGAYLLYSVATSDDNFSPRLYVITGSGANMGGGRRAINLFTTADRCIFSDAKTAYCAVPDSIPEGAGLSPEVLNDIPNAIYKVNIVTGAVTLIGRPDTDIPISALSVSKDGGTLFFTDGYSGNIKKMKLK
jgi:Tol biopolymer transport system component